MSDEEYWISQFFGTTAQAAELVAQDHSSDWLSQLVGSTAQSTEPVAQDHGSAGHSQFAGSTAKAADQVSLDHEIDWLSQLVGRTAKSTELVAQDHGSAGHSQFAGSTAQAADLVSLDHESDWLSQLVGSTAQSTEPVAQDHGSVGHSQFTGSTAQAADLVSLDHEIDWLSQLVGRTARSTELVAQDHGNDWLSQLVGSTAQSTEPVAQDHGRAGYSQFAGSTAEAAEMVAEDHGSILRHHLGGNLSEAAELAWRGRCSTVNRTQRRRSKIPNREGNGNNRNNSTAASRLRWTPYSCAKNRDIELVTQTSTITHPTPIYTAPPRPTPTNLTPPFPVQAYPPPIIQNPASSQPQVRPSSQPLLQNFQTSTQSANDSLPKLTPLVEPNSRPLDIHQTNSTKSQPTNSPTSPTFLIDRILNFSKPKKPLPRLIPISLPTSRVSSSSTKSRTPIRTSSVHTFASTSSNAAVVQSSNLVQIDNAKKITTTNQNVTSIDSSVHALNPMIQPRQLNHWSHDSPELNEHQQYLLWPGVNISDLDFTEEEPPPFDQTSIFDECLLGLRSPDSTVVPDTLQGTAAFLSSSPGAIVSLRPLTPATSSVTTPSDEDANNQQQ